MNEVVARVPRSKIWRDSLSRLSMPGPSFLPWARIVATVSERLVDLEQCGATADGLVLTFAWS
jgi:hypothetical protein